tara:strand:+ start:1059 stop:2657 length:1599 start_codon:yes stop_codon:yes gene_type:complete
MAQEVRLDLTATDKASAEIKKVKGEIKEAKEEQGLFADQTNRLKTSFTKLKGGVGKAVKSFKTLKGAIISTGIGVLVIAFGTLITYFSKSKEGSEKLDAIMAGLGATVTVLTDRVIGFGKGVLAFFSGDFTKGMDMIAGSVTALGTEIANETAKAFKLTERLQDIADAERDLAVARAENLLAVKRLDAVVDDVTNSEQVRIDAAQKAQDLLNENAELEQVLLTEKLEILKELDAQGDSSAEDLQEIADLQIRIAASDASRVDLARAFNTKLNAISEGRRNREETARLKAIDDEIAETERILKLKEDREKGIDAITGKFKLERDETELQAIESEQEKQLAELDRLKASEQDKADVKAFFSKKILGVLKTQADKENALEKAKVKATKDTNNETLAAVGGLAGALGKLAGDSKALAVGEATISTYLGATKALAAGAGTPIGYINAAAIIATGLANVKTILSTDVGSGGGGSVPSAGSVPSVGGNLAASIPASTGLGDVVNSVNAQGQAPVEAFVISQTVTDSQEAQSYINNQRTL